MIHQIVSAFVSQLNEFIRNELGLADDIVIASNLMDIKGGALMQIDNKVCVFVQNIEEEKLLKNTSFHSNNGMASQMFINIYVVFAANFPEPNYQEALRYVSLVIEFFQGKPLFDRSNTPELPTSVDKVAVEFFNQSIQDLNNLWSLIGAKYVPSVVYKVKTLPFHQQMIKQDVGQILSGQDLDAARKNLLRRLAADGLSEALALGEKQAKTDETRN
jgi:hypothetical protein